MAETAWSHQLAGLFLPHIFVRGAVILAVAILIARAWPRAPAFLRHAFVLTPVLLAAYLAAGFPGEIRVFYEAYPVAFALAALGTLSAQRR